jgi:hypothetical protein
VQTANLYQTKTASTASLALKRDVSDSMSSTEIQALAALDRPISSITGLQGELDNRAGQSATVVALSNKVDKEGSISLSESNANLVNRVKTAVPSNALFSDAIFNAATDVPNGSLEIAQSGGLTAVLGTFKNAADSDTADATLRTSINALADVVEALPASQILVNGTFLDQSRFSIAHATPVLNLGLSIWEWVVQPRWSDLQRDPVRVRHAAAGHLPMDASPASYCYFPRISGDEDMGPSGLHWVVPTSAGQTTEYGTYKLAEITPAMLGYNNGYRLFANANVPLSQPSSKGIGWPSASSDEWCIEFQIKLLDSNSSATLMWTPDGDIDSETPDRLTRVNLTPTSMLARTDDRAGGGESDTLEVDVGTSRWQHVAVQKPSGGHSVYYYLNGVLVSTLNYPSNAPQTIDSLSFYGEGGALWREFSVRASCPYPITPFTPSSPVSFASLLGLGQVRFNSYMLG